MGLPRGQGSQVLAEQDPAGSPWQCWPGLFPEVSPAPVPAVHVGTASSPRPLWNGGQAHALTQTRTHIIHKCLKQYFFIITKAGNNLGVLLLMNEQMMIYPFKGRLTSNKEQ